MVNFEDEGKGIEARLDELENAVNKIMEKLVGVS